MSGRLLVLGNSTSQWINANILFGDEDESISGRAYRRTREGSRRWAVVRRCINLPFRPWQKDHCHDSYMSDIELCAQRMHAHAKLMLETTHPS